MLGNGAVKVSDEILWRLFCWEKESFFFFIFLNYLGMKTSATFELTVTVIALLGLVVYWVLAAPHFDAARVLAEPMLPNGFSGVMAAV